MSVIEGEASVGSRESVDSLLTMGKAESTGSEAQRRRTACAWARSKRALDGEREQMHAGVVTQSMEGDRMDSLWRAMNLIEGGQRTSAEAKQVREKVVAAVEERWQAGEMQEPLPQGEARWQAYVRKLLQGRRMAGPPEVEAWAVRSGYRVKVYRETKDGAGYSKKQEYGGEKGVSVGILWKETRVYEVVWGQEEAVNRSTAREEDGEALCRGAQARVSVGSERGHGVASGKSRPSTCGTGSVGSTEGNEVEPQRKAAWASERREEALEGAREKTGDGVLIEHMYGRVAEDKARSGCQGGE